jgi:hypothetical protein
MNEINVMGFHVMNPSYAADWAPAFTEMNKYIQEAN